MTFNGRENQEEGYSSWPIPETNKESEPSERVRKTKRAEDIESDSADIEETERDEGGKHIQSFVMLPSSSIRQIHSFIDSLPSRDGPTLKMDSKSQEILYPQESLPSIEN